MFCNLLGTKRPGYEKNRLRIFYIILIKILRHKQFLYAFGLF